MSDSIEKQAGYCEQCGSEVNAAVQFCEACESAVTSASLVTLANSSAPTTVEASRPGRVQRVLLALGIAATMALILGAWFVSTWTPGRPVVEPEIPGSEVLFPVEPVGVDSINNTIDGKKVAIDGDGHIMNSPGLGVDRPVWCLVGPIESAFTLPVHRVEGQGTFSPPLQVLVPVLKEEVGNPKAASIRLSLSDINGEEQVSEHHLKGGNQWQPLGAKFLYDSRKAPYQLRFIATGFEGPIYIDHSFGSAAK